MISVSVIVPVYNAERYLERCVNSIFAQTFTDYELILVDDGSTDGSGKMCDDYAQSNPQVCVIHQANQGVSAARQKGLDAANGQYVIFADPDDWVEPTMLEELLEVAIKNILRANEFTYQSLLFQLPLKQKELLMAIAREGKAQGLTSSAFVKKYRLTSSSSVQSAIKGLLEKNFVTTNLGIYEVYDKFFALWLLEMVK